MRPTPTWRHLSIGAQAALYYGWNDQLVAPLSSVHYDDRVLQTTGPGENS